jgi:hypothetical protein
MFERVLSDLKRPLTKLRMVTEQFWGGYDLECPRPQAAVGCIWAHPKTGRSTGPPDVPDDAVNSAGDTWKKWSDADYGTWMQQQPKRLPNALSKYPGSLESIRETVSLRDTNIQMIVKLANIVLTPEKPTYDGGSWHVEGMKNEEIVSTFIYVRYSFLFLLI